MTADAVERGPVTDAERLARLSLSRIVEPGDLRVSGLVAELGAARLHELLAEDKDVQGVLGDAAGRLAVTDAGRDLQQADERGFRWVVPGDAEWPAALDDLDGCDPVMRVGRAPLGIWVKGQVRLDQLPPAVSVVGSRSATTYGTEVATELSAVVAAAGVAVVSGAAFGIDQAAHRGALAGDAPTVAVLACGVDRAYPAAHERLLAYIADHGAVVSEVGLGCSPTRLRFLSRNRLIAALGRGTVVVEAAARSGALNTATWATRLNRTLMGVPGPVTSEPSVGVHHLIRTGAATLVTGGDHVLELVGAAGEHVAEDPVGPERRRDRLTRRQQQVLEAVPVHRPAGSESIARAAGLGLVEVRATLEALCRRELVDFAGDGWRLAEGVSAG